MKTIIKTPTPDIEKSLSFYKTLKYLILNEKDPTLIYDGSAIIEIDTNRFARAGISFYKDNWTDEIEILKKTFSVIENKGEYITADPNGVAVYLKDSKDCPVIDLPEHHQSIIGNFSGLSLESLNFDKSVQFWSIFGYTIKAGNIKSGWVSMNNKTSIDISIMAYNTCPHLFYNPSFTYFNGSKNLQVIEKIRDAEIDITEEITYFNKEGIVDNIIIRDPGGYGFFIFSD